MKNYTIFNENGKVAKQVRLLEADISINLKPGQGFIEGSYNADEYYFDNGNPIAKEPKPGVLAEFDYFSKTWLTKPVEELALAKTDSLEKINNAMSLYRQRFITKIEGQSTVYQLKYNEAVRFMSDPNPDAANYKLIYAEVGIIADNAENVAQVYLQMNDIFMQALAESENLRLGYINQIELCTSIDVIDPIMQSFNATIAELNL